MEKRTRAVVWCLFSYAVGAMKTLFMIPRGVCRHHPSCMSYAKEVIMHEAWWRAGWLVFVRVITCNPFFSPVRGGYRHAGSAVESEE